jgi:hypothetical protein
MTHVVLGVKARRYLAQTVAFKDVPCISIMRLVLRLTWEVIINLALVD